MLNKKLVLLLPRFSSFEVPELNVYRMKFEGIEANVLVDSGASVNFISPVFAQQLVPFQKWKPFKESIPVVLGDGTYAKKQITHHIALQQDFSIRRSTQ